MPAIHNYVHFNKTCMKTAGNDVKQWAALTKEFFEYVCSVKAWCCLLFLALHTACYLGHRFLNRVGYSAFHPRMKLTCLNQRPNCTLGARRAPFSAFLLRQTLDAWQKEAEIQCATLYSLSCLLCIVCRSVDIQACSSRARMSDKRAWTK